MQDRPYNGEIKEILKTVNLINKIEKSRIIIYL